jgi:hypothetical protein
MTQVATYKDLQDGPSTLHFNGPVSRYFDIFDAPGALLSERPILFFRVAPDVGDDIVRLEMTLNGDPIVGVTFHSDEGRAWMEIVEDTALQLTGNQLVATVTSGTGSITVSEVVLLYKVNVV